MVAGGGRRQVAGGGEGGGGEEVAVLQAGLDGQSAQGGGEEAGGEGVPGAGGGHDGGAQGGLEGAVGPVPGEGGGAARPLLDDQHARLGQQSADGGRSAGGPPGVGRLVLADEHDVRAPGQLQQHAGALAVPPQPRPVVDVEGHRRAPGAGSRQLVQQLPAPRRQRGRDAGQVQHPGRADRRQVHVPYGHRGGGRAGPVVRHLVRARPPVAGGAEVHAGGPAGVAADGGDVDAVPGDPFHQVVAEAVRADPADPAGRVPEGGQGAHDVGLGAADGPVEGGDVGEAAGAAGQEGDHGLAERHHVRVRDGPRGRGDRGVSSVVDDDSCRSPGRRIR